MSSSDALGKRILGLLETDTAVAQLSLPSLERFRGALRLMYSRDNRCEIFIRIIHILVIVLALHTCNIQLEYI